MIQGIAEGVHFGAKIGGAVDTALGEFKFEVQVYAKAKMLNNKAHFSKYCYSQ